MQSGEGHDTDVESYLFFIYYYIYFKAFIIVFMLFPLQNAIGFQQLWEAVRQENICSSGLNHDVNQLGHEASASKQPRLESIRDATGHQGPQRWVSGNKHSCRTADCSSVIHSAAAQISTPVHCFNFFPDADFPKLILTKVPLFISPSLPQYRQRISSVHMLCYLSDSMVHWLQNTKQRIDYTVHIQLNI